MRAIRKFLGKFPLIRTLDCKIRGWRVEDIDLQAVEALRLPPNLGFQQVTESADRIEGMLSAFSMAAVDMMLAFQERLGAKGSILEIGTYKGKSAVVLGSHLRDGERLVLVDINDYLDRTAIEPIKEKTDFIMTPSGKLRSALPGYRAKRKSFRFIHIDASHGYHETFHELQMAEELLAPLGIIALDDFANLNYSQNIAAIFRYLFTANTRLTIFLATDEKAYLCRKSDFTKFEDLILTTSIAEMRSRNSDSVLARTSYSRQYKAIHLRPTPDGESGGFYGKAIYRREIAGRV
jgi:predicted O-methyltransferase YrrM